MVHHAIAAVSTDRVPCWTSCTAESAELGSSHPHHGRGSFNSSTAVNVLLRRGPPAGAAAPLRALRVLPRARGAVQCRSTAATGADEQHQLEHRPSRLAGAALLA